MENIPQRKGETLYKWLTLLLVEIPMGLIAFSLILVASCGAFYWFMIEMLAWGLIPPLAHFPFVIGGMAFMMFTRLLRKLTVAAGFIVLGCVIIFLGMWSGTLSGSIMNTSFKPSDAIPMILIGVGFGVLAGIGIKIGISVLNASQHDSQWMLTQNIRHLLLFLAVVTLLVGLPVSFIFSGIGTDGLTSGTTGLLVGIGVGILAALASGGIDVLHYVIARCVFALSFRVDSSVNVDM